jgi:helicase
VVSTAMISALLVTAVAAQQTQPKPQQAPTTATVPASPDPALGIEGLFPPQTALLQAGFLQSDDHWLICKPTGSGKTRAGEWAIERALASGFCAAYVAPLRAIIDERLIDWRSKYKSFEVGAFTGGSALHSLPCEERLLLFTPEKLAAFLANWKRHLSWLSKIKVLVVDEIHLLADPNRGPALESLIGRIERINPFIQIVGLSATLPNAQELATWLKARLFESGWRPVPITHRIRKFKRASDKEQMLIEEVEETLQARGRCLIFVNSRRRAEALSKHLADISHLLPLHRASRQRCKRALEPLWNLCTPSKILSRE